MDTWTFAAIYLPVLFSRYKSRSWIGLVSILAVGLGNMLDVYLLPEFTGGTAWLWYCILVVVTFGWAIAASISASPKAIRAIAIMASWFLFMSIYALIYGWVMEGAWGDPVRPYQGYVVLLLHILIATSAFLDRGTNALDFNPSHCFMRLGRVAMFQARKEGR
ncbi:hypothetical protein AVP3_0034 [Aeromonas phage AVP3]|nr:hypothetical protein [Aeromonas phage BUCT552]